MQSFIVALQRARIFVLMVFLCPYGSLAQPAPSGAVLTVTEARRDANGDFIPDLLGKRLTVAGRANVYSGVIHTDRMVVFLEDHASGIGLYNTEFAEPIAEGDSIVATGYLEQFEGLTRLSRVTYRKFICTGVSPPPPHVRVAEANDEVYESRLVTTEGEVTGKWADAYGSYLTLRERRGSNDSLVVFLLNRHKPGIDFKQFDAGDRLLITGVVIQFARGGALNAGYELIPRYPEDIVRLDSTSKSYLLILLISFGVLALSIIWIWMLRRQVSRQTARIRESEAWFRSVFEGAKDGMIVLGDGLRIKDANPAACALYGESREALRNKPFTELLGKEEVLQLMASADFELPTMVHEFETNLRGVSGENISLHAKINVVELDGARRHIVVLRDVTERKQTDEQKKILEAQIVQMQKLEAIGTLAAGIAHDFNNLLSGVFGYIEMARNNVDRAHYDKVRTYLTKSLNMAESARALTRQLTTFAKGGTPVRTMTALATLIRDTAALALSGTSLNAEYDLPEDLWLCNVDPNQISQVISNIVINARQAMPRNGKLFISAVNVPASGHLPPTLEQGNYVVIRLRDTGPGIPRELCSKIFEPFFTTKPGGHGLGLSTSYSIIRRHHGTLTVESEPGTGSTFVIYLPASPGEDAKLGFTDSPMHRGEGKVLVMDDEEYMRDLASGMLASMGYTVECVPDGAKALEKFVNAHAAGDGFDLTLLDLTIPGGMGGKETVSEILSIDASAKVVATSGYSDDEVMSDPGRFGFRDRLQKPYGMNELGGVMERLTKTKS